MISTFFFFSSFRERVNLYIDSKIVARLKRPDQKEYMDRVRERAREAKKVADSSREDARMIKRKDTDSEI